MISSKLHNYKEAVSYKMEQSALVIAAKNI